MSTLRWRVTAIGLACVCAVLAPATASGGDPSEAAAEDQTREAGRFPGWMRLIIPERSTQLPEGDAQSYNDAGSGEQSDNGHVKDGAADNSEQSGTSSGQDGSSDSNGSEQRGVESALEQAGLGPVVSRATATVMVSTIDRVERTGLEAALDRLVPTDPRRDAYIETASALFDAWSGGLDPAEDEPDARVVFVPSAPKEQVAAAMTEAGLSGDDWVLLDTDASRGQESGQERPWRIVGLSLVALSLVAAIIFGFRGRYGAPRVIVVILLIVLPVVVVRFIIAELPSAADESPGREWTVVSATGGSDNTEEADEAPFEAGQADFETDSDPDIPHFGILLSHLAYQEGFAWGRDFEPPRKGEVVEAPGTPVENARDGEWSVTFDSQWFEQRTAMEHDPLAALLRSVAGRAPLEYRRIATTVVQERSPEQLRELAHSAGPGGRRSLRRPAVRVLPHHYVIFGTPALLAALTAIFLVRLQPPHRSDNVVNRFDSDRSFIFCAFSLINCLRAKTCLRRHR